VAREQIAKQNPVVMAEKINKIWCMVMKGSLISWLGSRVLKFTPIDRLLQVVVWVSVVVGGINCAYPSPFIMVSFSRLCNNVNIFKL
jgi:hypothetical protein